MNAPKDQKGRGSQTICGKPWNGVGRTSQHPAQPLKLYSSVWKGSHYVLVRALIAELVALIWITQSALIVRDIILYQEPRSSTSVVAQTIPQGTGQSSLSSLSFSLDMTIQTVTRGDEGQSIMPIATSPFHLLC